MEEREGGEGLRMQHYVTNSVFRRLRSKALTCSRGPDNATLRLECSVILKEV
jgi:hypothetical protein